MNNQLKWLPVLAGGAALVLGAALQKVFSLNLSVDGRQAAVLETGLLLSDSTGLLSGAESRKIICKLDAFIAKPHTVQRSEWLEKIAKEYGVPAISLRSTNNLEDPAVRPNQTILVHNKKGMAHIARGEESLEAVIQAYEKLGSKREKILAANDLGEITILKEDGLYLTEGALLWVPEARRSFPVFSRPVAWSRISSWFGVRRHPVLKVRRMHDGFDLVAPYGAPVYAGDAGVVTYAGWRSGYGNLVEVRHSKTTTRYGHLSKVLVEAGQKVKRRQLVGRVGTSGLSTGAHLHFEVRRNSDGRLQNPRKYLY